MDAGGITIAVLGTPISQIHPQRNAHLAERILERGAIVSEYPSCAQIYPANFVYRNRIVAALADATLIVEAAANSGTMSTANYTLKQNKSVYAIPGDITRPLSEGCLNLIKSGAMVYTEPADLYYEFGIRSRHPVVDQYDGCTPEEKSIIHQIASGVNLDENIIAETGLSPAVFTQAITTLQLKNIIKSVGNGEWALV